MEIRVYEIALLPIIIGLVEVIKQFGIPTKYMPLVSIFIAECISCTFLINGGGVKEAVLVGLQLGLTAVGLHSGVKNALKSKDD